MQHDIIISDLLKTHFIVCFYVTWYIFVIKNMIYIMIDKIIEKNPYLDYLVKTKENSIQKQSESDSGKH